MDSKAAAAAGKEDFSKIEKDPPPPISKAVRQTCPTTECTVRYCTYIYAHFKCTFQLIVTIVISAIDHTATRQALRLPSLAPPKAQHPEHPTGTVEVCIVYPHPSTVQVQYIYSTIHSIRSAGPENVSYSTVSELRAPTTNLPILV